MFSNKIIEMSDNQYESDGIVIKYYADKYMIKIRQTLSDKYVWFLYHIKKDSGIYHLIAFSTKQFGSSQMAQSNAFDYMVNKGVYNK